MAINEGRAGLSCGSGFCGRNFRRRMSAIEHVLSHTHTYHAKPCTWERAAGA